MEILRRIFKPKSAGQFELTSQERADLIKTLFESWDRVSNDSEVLEKAEQADRKVKNISRLELMKRRFDI